MLKSPVEETKMLISDMTVSMATCGHLQTTPAGRRTGHIRQQISTHRVKHDEERQRCVDSFEIIHIVEYPGLQVNSGDVLPSKTGPVEQEAG